MARSLNKVMIIGNLGRDPEMRSLPSGKPVATFSVAVSRTTRPPEGEPDACGRHGCGGDRGRGVEESVGDVHASPSSLARLESAT